MNQPLISVIVPAYNSEPFITRCLTSIAKQTYNRFEVLIVDDASTDNSGRIAEEWAASDPRFRVFHRAANGGASAARNLALEHARGDYYAFVDSDDWIEPELLEGFLANALEYGADITISSSYIRNYADKSIEVGTMPPHVEVLAKEKAMRKLIVTGEINHMLWTKFFKKELFDGMCFCEGHTVEDQELMWRLFEKADQFAVIPISCYHYNLTRYSVTHSVRLKGLVDRWRVNKELFDQFASVDEEYYQSLLKQCGNAITRVWCWAFLATKAEKAAFRAPLQEMRSFSRTHCREVMSGKYPILTKMGYILSLFNNKVTFFLCYLLNQCRKIIKREKLN